MAREREQRQDDRDVCFARAGELSVLIGNEGSCVSAAIAAGDAWMATYGPVGSGVAGRSAAWQLGDPIHNPLDAYNNGLASYAPRTVSDPDDQMAQSRAIWPFPKSFGKAT